MFNQDGYIRVYRRKLNERNKDIKNKEYFLYMKVVYRISDSHNAKIRPPYFTKKQSFSHFLRIFKNHDVYVFADNIGEDTYNFILNYVDQSKIIRTNLGNSASFLNAVDFVLNIFDDSEKVYFAEDDYIYTQDAPMVIEEGLSIADYSSGYDHPDKYINHNEGGPNPFISEGGEETRCLLTKSRHWKITNSCCMTFATTVKTVKEDRSLYSKHCGDTYPRDFNLFCDLYAKGRKLVSCIPAVSTHAEIQLMAPLIDWEKEMKN